MVLLMILSFFSAIAILFVIWYCIYCYSNWLVATFITLLIVAILGATLYTTFSDPSDKETSAYIYKALHI